MRFEWNEIKRRINIRKHGIDFADIPRVFDGLTITIEDTRFDYGEARCITLGLLNGRVVVIAHTEQKNTIRIISARKANKNEEKNYFNQISNGLGTAGLDAR